MRVSGWEQSFARVVEEWRHKPFRYGAFDCCQFAAEVVVALRGIDYRKQFPAYSCKESADAIIEAMSGINGIVEKVMGAPKAVAEASIGDLVLGDFGNGLTLGVCVKGMLMDIECAAPGRDGLRFIPLERALAAWTV